MGFFLFCIFQISFALASDSIAELGKIKARFAPTPLKVNLSKLSSGDKKAVIKLIEASRVIDRIFLQQMWSGNLDLLSKLQKDRSEIGHLRLDLFNLNKGPWSELDEHVAFLEGVPSKKLPGGSYYPEDMTKEEFETWVAGLTKKDQDIARGFFSVIRRDKNNKLKMVPYRIEYKSELQVAAKLLQEAARTTSNASLRKFLNLRAKAFLTDDYYKSDVAWMDINAPVDVTIGPYETYVDEVFGFKAAFESYVLLRDDEETAKLQFFSKKLQEIENHLPIAAEFKNPKLGAMSPIRVVNEIFAAGDAAHGVRAAAYNLPNDEKVIKEKGSKKVMLKNVQEAKFKNILRPISKVVLNAEDQKNVSFGWFFTHILAHELSHGIGPHEIKVEGHKTNPRQQLKDLYGAIEEAKADITGLFALQYLFDHDKSGKLKGGPKSEREMYTTFLASAFRTLRFGLKEAHGRGMALQLNYLLDKGAFVIHPQGVFSVDLQKIKPAVRDLTHDLLMLEARGNYEEAKEFLDKLGVIRPEVEKVLTKLSNLPTDIDPIFVTANQIAPAKK